MNRAKLSFIRNGAQRFVKLDLELLQQHYHVTDCYLAARKDINPIQTWQQVKESDCLVCWFASWHSFLPALFARVLNKPFILITGGYDVANMPEVGYGNQTYGLKKWISRLGLQLASQLVAFSHFSREEAVRNVGVRREQVEVIYLGIPDTFGELPCMPRKAIALTVGNVWVENLQRKGHEFFVRAAPRLAKMAFVLAGECEPQALAYLKPLASPNVTFTGYLTAPALLEHYRQASVYVQASLHEGFGLSVAEAMLAGCIPAVTRAGALPEVVGETGIYLQDTTPAALAEGIRCAVEIGDERHRKQARERILQAFALERRQQALYSLIDELVA